MNTSKKRNNGILRRISVILLCFFVFMVTVVPTTMTAFAVAGDGSEADEEQVEMATEETQEEPAADETVEPAEPAPEEADAGEPEEPAEQVEAAEEEPEDEVTVTDEEPEPAGGDVAEEPVVKAADDGGLRATAPTKLWVAPSDTNNIPVQIDVFVSSTKTQQTTTTYTCELYFPGNANLSGCQLSWDGGLDATVGTTTRSSGSCPIPDVGSTTTYTFTSGRNTYKYTITTYQGSASVVPIFIDIDETFKEEGETTPHTIAAMDGDTTHEKYCVGQIYINGTQYELSKIKGRGNATWIESKDKKPYNITLGNKIKFPGIDSEKTKKWSLLAENLDHSLLGNRIGYHLAHEMGIGQDTASADVWMNGEYQGCYTVTPKTDSFVTKNGFMIEQDNYLEGIENGGDPQFKLDGMREANGWSSCYNRITVKKIGDNLLLKNGVVDDSDENLDAVSQGTIKPWLQDAWDAIRSDTGYNSKGKYYTDYIDIESFAKMYLMHEYVKSYDVCAGSIYFHRDGMTDDDKLFAGPLWDLDNAMGSVYQNGSLGNADDRSHGDRRRGDQAFISQLPNPSTIYKTSIYQTISKHDDFMEEVYKQYNKYHSQFDNLPDDLDQMISDVDASARMNHRKVTDLGNGTGKNNHYYASQTTLGTGQYQQTYLATTNSKTDWGNYAANLKTYVRVRSLWFHNTYRCTHTTLVKTEATAPTCTEPGNSAYWTCSTCGEYFSDANGETEIAADSWVIPATGHSLTAHPAVAATCTTAGNSAYWSCSTCGKYFSDANGTTEIAANSWVIAATGHGWGTPTYTWADDNSTVTATRVCGNDASHKETETVAATGVVTTAAGCETKGVRTYTSASFANAAFTVQTKAVDISPTGHDWNEPTWVWADDYSEATATFVCKNDPSNHIEIVKDTNPFTSSAEPTCTEGSAAAYVATVVFEGEEYSDVTSKFIPALGHDWSDWTVTQEPTCTATGTKTRTCSRCNETETETIAALGHTLTAHPAVAASCETGGNSAYWSCDRCGKYFSDAEGKTEIAANSWVIQATGHTPEVIPAVAATCTQPGSTEGSKCSVCGEILVAPQEIEALGHDYQDVPNTAVAPTCTTAGKKADRKCSHCGDVITGETIQATGHAPEVIPAVAATCTQPGSTEGSKCSVCGEILVAPQEIAALGHDYQEVPGSTVAPTCTTAGKEADQKCSHCGDVIPGAEIAALGHDYQVVPDSAVAPTCTTAGKEADQKCSHCGDVIPGAEISALGHDYQVVPNSAVAPTCTTAGKEADRKCSHCDDVIEGAEIAATGHVPEVIRAVAATCTQPGSTEGSKCSVCGEILVAPQEIAALGHDYQIVPDTAVAPTCTTAGKEADQKCSHCGDEIIGAEIAALGHDYQDVPNTAVAATCTTAGKEADQKCSHCGDEIIGAEIAAVGHDYQVVPNSAIAPTCTTAGKEADQKCSHCGDEIIGAEIAALGHDYQVVPNSAVAPTCTTTGKEADQKCSHCDDVIEGAEIAATGHSWGEWTVKTPATETEDGEEVRTCSVCSAQETRIIPATTHEHKLSKVEAKAPTCLTDGNTEYWICDQGEYACGRCFSDAEGANEIDIKDTVVKATGHDWDAPTYTWADDNTKVTAVRVCKKDGLHTEIELVNTSSEVTKAPTCSTKGETTYTATFTNGAFAEQTKTVADVDTISHTLTKTEAHKATFEEPGNREYWTCSVCGKHFSTESGEQEIDPLIASPETITLSALTFTYNGSAKKPSVTVKDTAGNIVDASNFEVTYSNNVNAGEATATVTFTGDYYEGTQTLTFTVKPATVAGSTVSGVAAKTYNGKAQTQNPTVVIGSKTLVKDTDYTLSYKNNTAAGTASVIIKGKGNYNGSKTLTFTIKKANNPLSIKARTATVKYSSLKSKTQTLAVTKVITFNKNGQGKMSYSKVSGNKNITINATTGTVTIKKGLKKGTYKVKVKVKAAGNTNYKASAVKEVTFTIVVK